MLNKVQIIGNMGADPEVRTFTNGGKVCNIRVATSQKWKDRNTGEVRERTEWHQIAIFAEHVINYAEQYLRKGSKIYVEGQLETRKWQDQSGQDRFTTEVVVRPYRGTVKGLDRAPAGQGGSNGGRQGTQAGSAGGASQGGAGRGYAPADMDDEIPF